MAITEHYVETELQKAIQQHWPPFVYEYPGIYALYSCYLNGARGTICATPLWDCEDIPVEWSSDTGEYTVPLGIISISGFQGDPFSDAHYYIDTLTAFLSLHGVTLPELPITAQP